MGYRKGYYRKDGTYVQGHYTSKTSSKQKVKSKKGCSLLMLALVSILGIEACNPESDCPIRKCSDYNSKLRPNKNSMKIWILIMTGFLVKTYQILKL